MEKKGQRPRKVLEKITPEQQLSLLMAENMHLQNKFDEAVEVIKRYNNKEQLGPHASHADEYLSKWGIV